MQIVFVHGHMFNVQTWSEAASLLAQEGVTIHFFSQLASARQALDLLGSQQIDLFIGQFFHDLPGNHDLLSAAQAVPHRIGIGQDPPPGFTSFSTSQAARFEAYLARISVTNYANGISFLRVGINGGKSLWLASTPSDGSGERCLPMLLQR